METEDEIPEEIISKIVDIARMSRADVVMVLGFFLKDSVEISIEAKNQLNQLFITRIPNQNEHPKLITTKGQTWPMIKKHKNKKAKHKR